MKLKQLPEDFIVEEIADLWLDKRGEYAIYRLEKENWTTPDALGVVRRRWKIDHHRLNYGGLKDRHARTTQHFSIFRGAARDLQQENIRVTYLGQQLEPFTAQQISANHFQITMRELTTGPVETIRLAAELLPRTAIPNYFDDQRFGSVSTDGRFIAAEMVHGRFEEALKMALTAPYEFDRGPQKKEKAQLKEHWGDWVTLKKGLERGHARSLVDYLVSHPSDFKGAVARLRPELQGLYLSAFQSHIWNRLLCGWLKQKFPQGDLLQLETKRESWPAPREIPEAMRNAWLNTYLPLASARLKPEPDAEWLPLLQQILAEEGLTLEGMRIPGMQKPFFSKGDRAALITPGRFTQESAVDELHPRKAKVVLRFDLPRGSYATIVVKWLMACDALNP